MPVQGFHPELVTFFGGLIQDAVKGLPLQLVPTEESIRARIDEAVAAVRADCAQREKAAVDSSVAAVTTEFEKERDDRRARHAAQLKELEVCHTNKMHAKDVELGNVKEAAARLEEQVANQDRAIVVLRSQVEQAQAERDGLRVELQQLFATKESQVQAEAAAKAEAEKSLGVVSARCEVLEQKRREAEECVQKLQQDIVQLRGACDQQSDLLQQLQGAHVTINELQVKVSSLEGAGEKQAELMCQLEVVCRENSDLKAQVSKLEGERQGLEQRLLQVTESFEDLKNASVIAVQKGREQIATLQAQIATLQAQVNELEQASMELAGYKSQCIGEMEEAQAKLQSLQASLAQMGTKRARVV
jgi:chromosome segregation ATPase